jgi:hypothetical protein
MDLESIETELKLRLSLRMKRAAAKSLAGRSGSVNEDCCVDDAILEVFGLKRHELDAETLAGCLLVCEDEARCSEDDLSKKEMGAAIQTLLGIDPDYRSHHCDPENGPAFHRVCMGFYGGNHCTCECHWPGADARDSGMPG